MTSGRCLATTRAARTGLRVGFPRDPSGILPLVVDLDVELPEDATEDTTRAERAVAWLTMTERMAGMLEALEGSQVYGRDRKDVPKAPTTHGVYLFSEAGQPLYVGRTGKTERAIKAGKPSASGFRARLAGHSTPGAGLSSASFALRLAMEQAAEEGIEVPAKRSERLQNERFRELFQAAKERITQMEFRVIEIEVDREAAVFEVHAAFVLATPYNSFATS
jgi:hypothetical protein